MVRIEIYTLNVAELYAVTIEKLNDDIHNAFKIETHMTESGKLIIFAFYK